MEKRKILVVGLIGLLLAAGLIWIGCDTDGECDGKCQSYGPLSVKDYDGCTGQNTCYSTCDATIAGRKRDLATSCDCK